MLLVTIEDLCKTDVIKYILSRSIITGELSKWSLALLELRLHYVPQKVIKGQILADHPCVDISTKIEMGIEIGYASLVPWTLQFDGSSTEESARAGIVITSPFGKKKYPFFF